MGGDDFPAELAVHAAGDEFAVDGGPGGGVIRRADILPRIAEILPAVVGPELTAIASLLGTPAGATIAWVHFLAFDLLIGRWIYLDSRERGVSVWLMGPILYLTLMLGPFGFLLYLLVRRVIRASANENAAPASQVLQ